LDLVVGDGAAGVVDVAVAGDEDVLEPAATAVTGEVEVDFGVLLGERPGDLLGDRVDGAAPGDPDVAGEGLGVAAVTAGVAAVTAGSAVTGTPRECGHTGKPGRNQEFTPRCEVGTAV
jgi:hypothetical protein